MDGFVQLHKKIMQWEWYTDVPTCKLFFHILLSANYKKAKWRGKEILPGQFITSLGHLSTETGLSVREVRTALHKLISTNEVTKQSTSLYTILTLNNWESYNTPTTNERQTKDKPKTTTNINNKEYKEYIETGDGEKIEDKTIKHKPDKKEIDFSEIEEHLKNFSPGTTRFCFFSSLLENRNLILFPLEKKGIEAIEKKLGEFRSKLGDEKSRIELESFWEHHHAEQTQMKSIVLRLNTWLTYSAKLK